MVQCDECDRWYHFECVGVTQEIQHHDWICSSCLGERHRSTSNPPNNITSDTAKAKRHSLPPSTTEPVSNQHVPVINIPRSQADQFVLNNKLPIMYTYAPTNTIISLTAPDTSLVTVTAPSAASLSNDFPSSSLVSKNVEPVNTSRITFCEFQPTNAPRVLLSSSSVIQTPLTSRMSTQPVHQATVPSMETTRVPPLNNPQQNLNQGPVDTSRQSSKAPSSKMSTSQRRLQLQLQMLDEERKLQEEEETRRREYLRKRYNLLMDIANEEASQISPEEDGSIEKVERWLQNERQVNQQQLLCVPSVPADTVAPISMRLQQQRLTCQSACTQHNPLPQQQPVYQQPNQRPSSYQRHAVQSNDVRAHTSARQSQIVNTNVPEFVPMQRSTPRGYTVQGEVEMGDNISRSQVAARQAVSRELPVFNGSPEEWPLFFATFNTTTSMCGYTPEENLVRLQKCLKGKAYEAVKCRLMHPANVPGIISTLKMLYGNPEIIVQSVIAKIQATSPPKADKLESLIEFALAVQNLYATIEACGLEEYSYNVTLQRELVEKLPPTLKLEWAKHRRSLPNANLSGFAVWLYDLAETISPIAAMAVYESKSSVTTKKKTAFFNTHTEQIESSSTFKPTPLPGNSRSETFAPLCIICKQHCLSVEKCARFAELSYSSRWATVHEFGLCRKCLKKHKGACKKQQTCGKNGCTFKHHELLHNYQRDYTRQTVPNTLPKAPTEGDCNTHVYPTNRVLFRVVPVFLHGRQKHIKTYAFLDDGSSLTMIDSTLAAELDLNSQPDPLCLQWTGDKRRYEENSRKFSIEISGIGGNHKKYRLQEVHTVSNLGLFQQSLDVEDLSKKYEHLRGVPVEAYFNVQPQLLIGMDNQCLIRHLKGKEGGMREPIATKTRLGWIIHGSLGETSSNYVGYHSVHVCQCEESTNELQQATRDYFALDSLGIVKPDKLLLSSEDKRAQDLLRTITRTESGRYETNLLWRYPNFYLPNSKPMALRRFRCLESRLKKNPTLDVKMRSTIASYLEKGYIRKLSDEEINKTEKHVWYLPIFPVFNPNKPGKVRIVWDAAAKVGGVSLNSFLLKGPDQLNSLNSVLLKFRQHRVAVCGDIREMFHQILISKTDQNCQRFFWRYESMDAEPSVYVMQVMTFGACCSPSCAQYVKNLNANQYAGQYPRASEAIHRNHYVDDMLVSVETEEEAIKLAQEVRFIHSQAGFEIRNWMSNSAEVLNALEQGEMNEKDLNVGAEMATEKVLGMWWCTATDTFTYKLSAKHDVELLTGRRKPTKRDMLRTLACIFDPLGLISNLLIYLKVLLQEVWRTSTGWDDEIPESLYEKWEYWLAFLPSVEHIRIPRCYQSKTSLGPQTTVQLHTFVDASELGYAAVVYLRFEERGVTECGIVSAKSRVAPLKFVSIPRLELQAAVIGTRLADTVIQSLTIKVDQRIFWTDSRDVLCWIRSDHRRYSQFVAFRVSEILDTTNTEEWRWIPTKENVADEATKWQRKPGLEIGCRWFCGPDFLWQSSEHWPTGALDIGTTDAELRVSVSYHNIVPTSAMNAENFSSWKRLLRVTAYVLRFPSNVRRHMEGKQQCDGPLSSEELQQAEEYLLKQAQRDVYSSDIAVLSTNGMSLRKSSHIFQLNPFLDGKHIMRMHGRIGLCEYASMDAKNPIILPKNHHITELIVRDIHERYHHRNHSTVANELRQKYCIPKLKRVLRKVRTNCQICKNLTATPHPPPMGDLPSGRLAAFTRPFSHAGIDYFGPISVSVGRRCEKRWGVLITCLTIRAIHIEIVHSLSANSCILAVRNFMARRGVPIQFYSDRGTNFTATSKELKKALLELNQEQVMKEIVSQHTSWTFIPPVSPHMGGAWERLVQSVKVNLARIKMQRNPSDEVLRNVLIEIENIINSRPLTEVPIDEADEQVLTPNHFLLGSSSGLKPATLLTDDAVTLRQSWKSSQVEANLFWRRWVRDYLPVITRRTKWFASVAPVEVGDVVLIVDPAFPRNCWPKGRILSVNKGLDGHVRSAAVQTISGIYERPVVKLAVLDVRRDRDVNLETGVPGGSVTTA